MSIEDQLVAREKDGSIHAFKPPKGFKAKRALYISTPVLREITGPNTNVAFHKCKMDIERVFDSWVKGDEFRVSATGAGKGATWQNLTRLRKEFGSFALLNQRLNFAFSASSQKKDVLVATGIENRGILGNKYTANGKFAVQWQRVMHGSNNAWNGLFSSCAPAVTTDLNLLISGWTHAVRN
ncbi:hypothetical protein HFN60_32960 [Rhizobium leguminosarum]|uniref:hypothetical protein n=1 Tax=Rhizobium leguminosarum TaxID=384 RepID=UPI001C94F5E2|nr:hypothetical protein [Rhizobium leguminosarum]MBY5820401.1 hypothetical protein [Rhizobium leguminosarum]